MPFAEANITPCHKLCFCQVAFPGSLACFSTVTALLQFLGDGDFLVVAFEFTRNLEQIISKRQRFVCKSSGLLQVC